MLPQKKKLPLKTKETDVLIKVIVKKIGLSVKF